MVKKRNSEWLKATDNGCEILVDGGIQSGHQRAISGKKNAVHRLNVSRSWASV
jgi:hypothetical protein